MVGFVFLPIVSSSATWQMEQWEKGRRAKGKAPYEVITKCYPAAPRKGFAGQVSDYTKYRPGPPRTLPGQTPGCLAKVRATDKLYIAIHGIKLWFEINSMSMGEYVPSGGSVLYSPAEMSKLLEQEGLTKQIKDIRLYVCNSYELARLLKEEMVKSGYHFVQVTGYLGVVSSVYWEVELFNEVHKATTLRGEDFARRASSHRLTF